MVVGEKLTAVQCNFTHQDKIWKDYVHKEHTSRKKWRSDWGFLQDEYHTLYKSMNDVRLPQIKSSANSTPSQQTVVKSQTPLKLPPLKPTKQISSNPFPMVTSKEIGWRSERHYNLEVYGRWGRPKNCIIKEFKWPVDAVP